MGRFIIKEFLFETPTLDKDEFENLPIDVWFSHLRGNHNNVRVKFADTDSNDVPLQITRTGLVLDKKYKVNSLRTKAKIFYQVCDWVICNRDIINSYAHCNNTSNIYDEKTMDLLHQRDKEITQNKQQFMIPYIKTNYGCQFVTPIQIPFNIELEKMSAKINEQFKEVDKFSAELMGK